MSIQCTARFAATSRGTRAEMGAAAAYPEVEYALGVIAGSRGDVKAGAGHLTRFLQLAPGHPAAKAVKKQLAEWGQPAGGSGAR